MRLGIICQSEHLKSVFLNRVLKKCPSQQNPQKYPSNLMLCVLLNMVPCNVCPKCSLPVPKGWAKTAKDLHESSFYKRIGDHYCYLGIYNELEIKLCGLCSRIWDVSSHNLKIYRHGLGSGLQAKGIDKTLMFHPRRSAPLKYHQHHQFGLIFGRFEQSLVIDRQTLEHELAAASWVFFRGHGGAFYR